MLGKDTVKCPFIFLVTLIDKYAIEYDNIDKSLSQLLMTLPDEKITSILGGIYDIGANIFNNEFCYNTSSIKMKNQIDTKHNHQSK